MYQHILIPTDGSEPSKIALHEGIALAKALSARVTALTVTTPFHVFTSDPSMIADSAGQYEKHVKALAEQRLSEAKEVARMAAVPCDVVHVEHEHPYQAIIETAQNLGCDVIQMASHGRRGISAIVLGSETLKVLTHSTIPVIVCRQPHPAALSEIR
jgi:nucleotide-binding universal stress UspA family protein